MLPHQMAFPGSYSVRFLYFIPGAVVRRRVLRVYNHQAAMGSDASAADHRHCWSSSFTGVIAIATIAQGVATALLNL